MARPRKHDGVVYQRNDSKTWWMRYRDKNGRRCLESTNTTDWEEAQRQLRERLQSRDNNALEFIRKRESRGRRRVLIRRLRTRGVLIRF
jgi:hypothetical protein